MSIEWKLNLKYQHEPKHLSSVNYVTQSWQICHIKVEDKNAK